MRVSRRMCIYSSGSKKSSVTLIGAPNELVSYSGVESGSVMLNSDSVAVVDLSKGLYTFVGGISGYMSTAIVENDSTVLVRPQYAIYWYGASIDDCGGAYDTELYRKSSDSKGVCKNNLTLNSNNMQLNLRAGGVSYDGCFYHTSPISLAGKTEWHIRGVVDHTQDTYGSSNAYTRLICMFKEDKTSPNVGTNYGSLTTMINESDTGRVLELSQNISTDISGYFAIGGNTSGYYALSWININAVWLE